MVEKSQSKLIETRNWWVASEFEGYIDASNYHEHIVAPINHILSQNNKFNLLFSFKDFVGWTPEAAGLSMACILKQCSYANRVAYVNPPASKILQMKLIRQLAPQLDVRFFNADEYDRAMFWIREQDQPCSTPPYC